MEVHSAMKFNYNPTLGRESAGSLQKSIPNPSDRHLAASLNIAANEMMANKVAGCLKALYGESGA